MLGLVDFHACWKLRVKCYMMYILLIVVKKKKNNNNNNNNNSNTKVGLLCDDKDTNDSYCYVYIFLLLCLYILIDKYALFCILIANWHFPATLTEVFPCFFLSCKANARVYLAKTVHGPHSS